MNDKHIPISSPEGKKAEEEFEAAVRELASKATEAGLDNYRATHVLGVVASDAYYYNINGENKSIKKG